MKPIVAIILSLCMTLSVAFAEIDLSTMTLDELKSLKDSINNEIFNRIGDESVNFYQGVYVAGKSIKPGSYNFLCLNSSYEVQVNIFANEESYAAYSTSNRSYTDLHANAYSSTYIPVGESYFFKIDEGNVVVIENGDGYITKVESDWMM